MVACSFWVACVIENMLPRKPFEFKWPEVRFKRKQTSMAQVPYNKVKVKSAYKPSGPPDQGLSRFL